MSLTDEHAALAESIAALADRAGALSQSRQAADAVDDRLPSIWSTLAANELLSLPIDAELLDVAVAAESSGRSLVPGPYLPTAVVATLVRRYAAQPLLDDVVAGLAGGSMSFAVQVAENLVLGGCDVSHALLAADDGGWVLAPVGDLELASGPGIDPTRRVATVSRPIGSVGEPLPGLTDEAVRERFAVLASAEAVGIAAWCTDTAVEYAKVREQFGKPIGAFQAVKHRCADMLCRLELARAAVWDAATALDDVGSDAERAGPAAGPRQLAVAVAAALGPDAAVQCAKDCIQVLGGIGFTWEHDSHLYLKRALASRQLLGDDWPSVAARLARDGVRRTRAIDLGDDAEATRQAVREFLAGVRDLTDDRQCRVAIADAGYLVPHWPAPYGRSASPVEQLVIDEEFRAAGVRRPDLIIGNWALPTILQYGSDEQRQRFAPPTLYGDISWCQMFSEPGAGSDLAALQTKAVRVEPADGGGAGGGWSLSGQKVWTSSARTADWAICLARTSTESKRQDGITYFLVDMASPGLDVRPLRELTGEALFNEIFLTDVFVPNDCVVGQVGGGWALARTTLANERVSMSGGTAFPSGVEDLLEALAASGRDTDPVALAEVGRLVCLAQADAMLGVRSTLARVSGTDPGAASSVRKLVGMHLRQDVSELALQLLGSSAVATSDVAGPALHRFLATRSLTIAGGTSEVLHNVIGERILGLAR